MGYESLSTVVVLVIVAIIIVVWLPVRTANGMKRVDEHRQDRYSPSLHIVDAENGRRFGDIKPHKAKGAAMPASTPSARLTSEHIAHVRELRRAAIRRRQILAVCLLAITVLVFAVSFPLHFSPLLALIPFVLLLLVLVLGANASRQARQWERKVVRYERAHSGTGWSKKPSAESKDSKRVNKAEPVAAVTAPAEKPAEQIEDAATEVMEQRQIRRALRDAEIEQAKAKALRQSAAAYQAAEEHAKQSEKSDIAQSAADKPAAEPSAMSMNPPTVSPLPKPANLPPHLMPPFAQTSRLSRTSPSPLELNHRLRCVTSAMSATMPLPLPMPRRNWSAYALPEHWTSSICPPRRISSPSLWVGNITPTTLRKAWRSSRPVRCPRRNLSNPQWRKS